MPMGVSFPQARINSDDSIIQLPKPCINGDSVCIKPTREVCDRGVEACKNNLHGRLVMSKGDKPSLTDRDLSSKLSSVWKDLGSMQINISWLWHVGSMNFNFPVRKTE